MRLEFEHDDEKAAFEARVLLVERFAAWLSEHEEHSSADAWDAQLMLDWKWAYSDGDYGTWTRADVDELLLEHLPRKLSALPQEATSIPASIAAFVAFLDDEDLLADRSDAPTVVAQRALAQQRAFLDAMVDPRNFGMAKRLFSSVGFDPDEVPDQRALDEVMASFNALSYEERGRFLGFEDPDLGEPSTGFPCLPLRPFPDDTTLNLRARDVSLLQQVDMLRDSLGRDGIKLTKAGNPTVADGKRLAVAVGVDVAIGAIRSSAELPGLFAVGTVAQLAGAVEIDGNRLRPTGGWASHSPAERWCAIADAVLEAGAATLCFGATVPMPLQLAEVADNGALHFLAMLWLADEPVGADVFADLLHEAATNDPSARRLLGPQAEDRLGICDDRVADVFASLASAGVVDIEEDGVRLTAAGAAFVAPVLADAGFDVVLADEIAAMPAGEVINMVIDRNDDPAVAASLWAHDRDPRQLAEELVADLVERPEPGRMLIGFGLLEALGDAATEPVMAARDSIVGPQAWVFLASLGAIDPDEVPREMVMRAAVDLFLAMADLGAPADVIESILGGQPVAEHPLFIDELAGTDHPRTGELLELIGRHHPDKVIAKHARKAAHRWRSRHGRR